MKKRLPVILLAVVSLLVLSAPLLAHHSLSWADKDHPITLTGTVTRFDFFNPHGEIWIDVKKDDGSTEQWMIETASVAALRRDGWDTDTVKPGDVIRITAGASKDGRKIIDGTVPLAADNQKFLINGHPTPSRKAQGPFGAGEGSK